ncbi:LPS export ABC transporter periplasmic protein LptC [Marinobacter salicampi]|uniref:LPS export ABC transporter periplasmic protein LptC n=1 Tax=Marinobacter salicampi TaxID=435907 RepID=UPI00140E8ECE|nr:LPS export ABC transporter periplasmic protein LptC [Marinobacter salicampi]
MSLKSLLRRRRVRNPALVIALLVLASLIWQSDETREPKDVVDLRGPSEPDGFVVQGRYLSFDEQGNLAAIIESPRIEQFESRGVATMMSPKASVYDENSESPWTITAERGEVLQGKDILQLEQDVLVRRTLEDGREGTLATETLTLDNQGRTAYTSAPVVITDQHSVTRAVGMRAWLDDRVVELQSQVEGRYETVQPGQE